MTSFGWLQDRAADEYFRLYDNMIKHSLNLPINYIDMFFEHPRPIAITFWKYRAGKKSWEYPRSMSTRIVYILDICDYNPGPVSPISIPTEQ